MFQLSRCLHEIDFIFYLFCYNRFYSRICYLLLNLSPQEKTSNSFYRRAAKKQKVRDRMKFSNYTRSVSKNR